LVTPPSVIARDRETRQSRGLINFWPSHNDTDYVPLVFCNVVGEEEELVVTTEEGNQRSKSNLKERDKVVRYYWRLDLKSLKVISWLILNPSPISIFISVIHSLVTQIPPVFQVPILPLQDDRCGTMEHRKLQYMSLFMVFLL